VEQSFVKALLLGENASGSSYLRWQLENRGCHCWFAHSTKEAAASFQEQKFDLILSTTPLSKFDPLLALLGSSTCKIFHCQPEEDSCWWLPLALGEQKSAGPGMRPSEFLEMLDKMLAQRRVKVLAPQPIPAIQPQLRTFKAAF
jgi:CheY-like chemotaxis protein